MRNRKFGKPDDKELLRIFDRKFMKLGGEDRLSVQLAVTAFAYAYLQYPAVRRTGLTENSYRGIAQEVLETDRADKGVFSGADSEKGLELLLQIGGCTEQEEMPRRYAPTDIGDKAIMYTIGKTMT